MGNDFFSHGPPLEQSPIHCEIHEGFSYPDFYYITSYAGSSPPSLSQSVSTVLLYLFCWGCWYIVNHLYEASLVSLFFTTPSFPATIIHPINPMTDFSNKCSNKCNSPQFWYKFYIWNNTQFSQDLILTNIFFSKVENLYKNFLDTRSNFPQDPLPTTNSHNFWWCFNIYRFRVFTSTKRPNSHKKRPLPSHNFWKGLKKKVYFGVFTWTHEDPIPNIDFVGLSVDPLSYLSVGKVGETFLDSHLDIKFFLGLQ